MQVPACDSHKIVCRPHQMKQRLRRQELANRGAQHLRGYESERYQVHADACPHTFWCDRCTAESVGRGAALQTAGTRPPAEYWASATTKRCYTACKRTQPGCT